ncbi:MAG: hypothetical protein NVSMB36_24890 [Escherichia coli]
MPDDSAKVAFLFGPVVLAGDLGRIPVDQVSPYVSEQGANFRKAVAEVPALVTENKNLTINVKRVSEQELIFRTGSIARPFEVTLRPFNEIFYEYYNIYWTVLTPPQYEEQMAVRREEIARRAALDARTIDEYRPGEQQSEVDHNQKGEKTISGDWQGRKFRHADEGGWFSFTMKVIPNTPLELVCTYWGGEKGHRTFDILVDGLVIATQTLDMDQPGDFFERIYPINAELLRGKQQMEVRFQARQGNLAGGLYGAKILRVVR